MITKERLKEENRQLKEKIEELEEQTMFIKENGTCAFCEKLHKDLEEENEILKRALELFSIATCTGARPDLTNAMKRFVWRKEVIDYFINQAKESEKNESNTPTTK